jgi:hypothetical protein
MWGCSGDKDVAGLTSAFMAQTLHDRQRNWSITGQFYLGTPVLERGWYSFSVMQLQVDRVEPSCGRGAHNPGSVMTTRQRRRRAVDRLP